VTALIIARKVAIVNAASEAAKDAAKAAS